MGPTKAFQTLPRRQSWPDFTESLPEYSDRRGGEQPRFKPGAALQSRCVSKAAARAELANLALLDRDWGRDNRMRFKMEAGLILITWLRMPDGALNSDQAYQCDCENNYESRCDHL